MALGVIGAGLAVGVGALFLARRAGLAAAFVAAGALGAMAAANEDRAARRETYLVASGERDAALKLLEQRLGTSCERLESYLRCRFMVFDPKEIGKIDMADFGALLGLLRDGRDAMDLEKQLMILDVDGDGMVSYLELVRWWLREEKLEGEATAE